ncbi:MAG: hypothetical protein NTW50_04750 [Candidatus Berkelbacteria bacterium]|nr:hypothetical protein [Candidatus Berkelbacteria bacterium]
MKEEKFFCPECEIVRFDGNECPECGGSLEKIKGDEFPYGSEESEDGAPEPTVEAFDDDPDSISWYSEEGEKLNTI